VEKLERSDQAAAPSLRADPRSDTPPRGQTKGGPGLPRFRAQARLGDKAGAGARNRSRLHSPPPATQR
jgi:hypothetical protein